MLRRLRHRSTYTDERGFTMIAAIIVLFIGSLLLTATYLSANGDIKLTRTSLNSKKAYYAALAGIANFEYHLNTDSDYETECPVVKEATVPQSTTESKTEPTIETYSYQVVAASESAYSVCTNTSTLSMIESNKRATGTFRVISTGTAGTKNKPGYQTRSVVATFTHAGFTHWVYYTNYEDLDPSFYKPTANCEQHHEQLEEQKITECIQIEFITGDTLNGPVHTNDAADICGEPVFGREGHEDKIEIGQGTYSSCGSDNPKFRGKEEKGKEITPPATDAELANVASSEYHFEGKTLITLNANLSKPEEANTITVTNKGETKTLPWPVSGVLYVSNSSSGCGYTYTPFGSTYTTDEGCGNAYVHGTYTKSLTIGAENNIVINGNIQTQTNSEGQPEGNAVLGLIATNYIRVYHPVKQSYTLENKVPKTEAATSEEIAREACGTNFVKRTGTLVSENSYSPHKKEITGLSPTSGLSSGMEVIGNYIPSGTTITVKSSSVVELSEYPTKTGVKEEIYFYSPLTNGYEYAPTLKMCVEPTPSGYTFNESEDLFVKGSCEKGTTLTKGDVCVYEISSKGCSSKATNLSPTEDPNKWGSLENPIIDAAILTTAHSFIVDNYACGKAWAN